MIRLHDLVARNAWRDPGGDACVDPATGRRLTHGALADRAGRLATAMRGQLGLDPGDRVAIMARNSAEYLEIFMAAAAAGVIAVPLNWRLSTPELVRVLDDAAPRSLLHSSAFSDEVERLQRNVDTGQWIGFDPGEDSAYEDLLAATTTDPEIAAGTAHGDDDELLVLYTGGTTGLPKGVLHSHRSAWTAMLNQDATERVQPDDVYLLLGQMFHIPIVLAFNYLSRGRPVVLLSFDAEATLAVIEQERVSGFLGVTTMLNHLLALDDLESYDLNSLRIVQYGGGPMGEDVVREALERLPCDLQQGYGQTEGGTMTFLSAQDHLDAVDGVATHRLRSCGREALLSDVRLLDEDGQPVPRDGETVGEIVTRSDANMLRYWNRPEETAATVRDGWIHTGDLATWDEDGYFFIKDRKKDLIISGGENIYPAQVENALYSHHAVLEAAVFGIPDDEWGEAVKAVVTLRPGRSATEEELIDVCREELASYMKPRSVDIVDEMPTSPTGKLLKRELRDPYWEDSDRDI